MAAGISNDQIDEVMRVAFIHGALSGKVSGEIYLVIDLIIHVGTSHFMYILISTIT